MAATGDPLDDLADFVLNDGTELTEFMELMKPLMAPKLWETLCEKLEICPQHICDWQICRDDQADCQPEADEPEAAPDRYGLRS